MIPETFGTFLAFLGLVAPGLTYQLVTERRRPRREETAFREASRIALASLVFTSGSLLLLLGLRAGFPSRFPNVQAWIAGGNGYLSGHFELVAVAVGLEVLVASGFAALAAWLLTARSEASISPVGAWYQMFRDDRPSNTTPWVHVRLEDETEFWGYLRHYAADDSASVRELVLGGSTLMWKRKGDGDRSVFGDAWDATCINAERIQYMRVIYRSRSNEGLFGRRTAEAPNGTPRS